MKPDETLHELLEQCNQKYQVLNRFMNQLLPRIETDSPLTIQEILRELETLQNEAATLDQRLRAGSKHQNWTQVPAAAINKRKELLLELVENNSLLIDKLEGRMSVMTHELDINHKSRLAMNGYRLPQDERGSRVLRSS